MFELITYSILAFLALILLMVFMLLYAKSKLVNSGAVKIKINASAQLLKKIRPGMNVEVSVVTK